MYFCLLSVGKFISTKKAFGRGSWRDMTSNCYDPDREDLTKVYKYEEGGHFDVRMCVRPFVRYSVYILFSRYY